MIFRVCSYELKDEKGKTYLGHYTIKDGVKPMNFKNEKLVDEFELELPLLNKN